jgi:hypothetical protein
LGKRGEGEKGNGREREEIKGQLLKRGTKI